MKNFTIKQKINFLKKTLLFSDWNTEKLEKVVSVSETLFRSAESVIFGAEHIGDRFYLILSGNVVILSPEDNSVLAEFVTGEMFGEMAFITRSPQKAVAVTNEDSIILEFPKNGEDLSSVFIGEEQILAGLLKSFLITVSKRTRNANKLIKENSPLMQELRKQVYADKLTGLLNKAYLEENLKDFMKEKCALIMLKPDNFKMINDTFGHEKGDLCLVLIGKHLSHIADTDSVLIRYQGNEFAVIHPLFDKNQAFTFARTIQEELENLDLSAAIAAGSTHLKISLGIALYPEHGKTSTELIKACVELPLAGRNAGGSKILFPEDVNE